MSRGTLALDVLRCPICAAPIEIDGDPDYRVCFWCGWDNYPRCGHGIIEFEFCVHCPEGGA